MVQAFFSTCPKTLSNGTCEPKQHGSCIAILFGLDPGDCPLKASWFQIFERLTTGRLSYFPGNVKFCESPVRAGVYLRIGNDALKPESLKVLLKKEREIIKERG